MELDGWIEEFDANKDGFICINEWIAAVVGKPFSLAPGINASSSIDERPPPSEVLDANKEPIVVGGIYAFTGGG